MKKRQEINIFCPHCRDCMTSELVYDENDDAWKDNVICCGYKIEIKVTDIFNHEQNTPT